MRFLVTTEELPGTEHSSSLSSAIDEHTMDTLEPSLHESDTIEHQQIESDGSNTLTTHSTFTPAVSMDFSDFEDEFIFGGYAQQHEDAELEHGTNEHANGGDEQLQEILEDDTPLAVNHSPTMPTTDDDAAPARRSKGTTTKNKRRKRGRGRSRSSARRQRVDSLPRSRLRMNTAPCGADLKRYASQLIGACSVPHAMAKGAVVDENVFYSANQYEEEPSLEPGSRTVTEKEVKESTGYERDGWVEAAWAEYKESFLDMQAISVSTQSEIRAFGGQHKALPMKLVWVQKPEKKNVVE